MDQFSMQVTGGLLQISRQIHRQVCGILIEWASQTDYDCTQPDLCALSRTLFIFVMRIATGDAESANRRIVDEYVSHTPPDMK
jgi:hypothetical protein